MSAVSLPERFVGEILRIHPGGLTVEQSSAGRCGEGRPHAQSAIASAQRQVARAHNWRTKSLGPQWNSW